MTTDRPRSTLVRNVLLGLTVLGGAGAAAVYAS